MLLLPIVGGLAGYFYSINEEEVYEAREILLVQQRNLGSIPGVSDSSLSSQLASTYGRMVTASPFQSKVKADNDLSRLGSLSASVGNSPPTLEIRVRDHDPGFAANVVDIVSRDFIAYVRLQRLTEIAQLQQAAAAAGLATGQDLTVAMLVSIDNLSVLEPAGVPSRPILPRTNQNILLGVVLGLMLATAGALLLNNLGDTVRSAERLDSRFGVTALGTIFRWPLEEFAEGEQVVWKAPASAYSESFRQVRANLQFSTAGNPGKVYLVTSPGPGEGKTTIIANLAVTLAHSGKQVIVIDGDMRRPSVHRRFKPQNREPGLSNYLSEPDTDIRDVIHATEVEGVSVIPAGPIPPNPSELLGSPRMTAMLESAQRHADMVLVDSPPVLMVVDGRTLAAQVDGAIVVADAFKTRSSALQTALDGLRDTNVRIVGVILNKLRRARFSYGYGYPYYYNYYYDRYYGESDGKVPLYRRPVEWVRSAVSRRSQ